MPAKTISNMTASRATTLPPINGDITSGWPVVLTAGTGVTGVEKAVVQSARSGWRQANDRILPWSDSTSRWYERAGIGREASTDEIATRALAAVLEVAVTRSTRIW